MKQFDDVESLLNKLSHYGVKGMKWGYYKEDNDIVVSKGTEMHNISDKTARDTSGVVYTSHTKADILNYRANLGASRKASGEKVFENTFEAKKDIKAPSQKKAVAEFKKLYEKDPEGVLRGLARSKKHMDLSAAIAHRVFKLDRDEAYYRRLSKKGDGWMETKGYDNFVRSFGTQGSEDARAKYFARLSKDGYNAILDVNDLKNYGSEEPLLVFNGDKNLKTKSVVELSKSDINRAMREYQTYRF